MSGGWPPKALFIGIAITAAQYLLAVHRYFRSAFAVGAVAIVMAGLRVAYGAHYFSDAVLGFTMTIVIFLVLAAFAEWTVARQR